LISAILIDPFNADCSYFKRKSDKIADLVDFQIARIDQSAARKTNENTACHMYGFVDIVKKTSLKHFFSLLTN